MCGVVALAGCSVNFDNEQEMGRKGREKRVRNVLVEKGRRGASRVGARSGVLVLYSTVDTLRFYACSGRRKVFFGILLVALP